MDSEFSLYMYFTFLFLFGLGIGSFINVVVLRLRTSESIVFGASRCLACGKGLHAHELIPLFSFVFQKGRCRNCSVRLSWQYPLVELITAITFVLIGYCVGVPNELYGRSTMFLLLALAFFSLGIALSIYDIRHKIIPDVFNYTAIVIAAMYAWFSGDIFTHLLSALGAFLFFGSLWLMSKGQWMGFGDAKLGLAMGFLLGFPHTILALMISFWAGALWGISFLLLGRYSRKSEVPFAPFLVIGTLCTFLIGSEIIHWYTEVVPLYFL